MGCCFCCLSQSEQVISAAASPFAVIVADAQLAPLLITYGISDCWTMSYLVLLSMPDRRVLGG